MNNTQAVERDVADQMSSQEQLRQVNKVIADLRAVSERLDKAATAVLDKHGPSSSHV